MIRNHQGTTTVEWIVVAVIVVSLIGGSVLALGDTIGDKLRDINVQIGS